MITPSLLAEFADQIQGETLHDVLFDLFEEIFEGQTHRLTRNQMWELLDKDPKIADRFAHYFMLKLSYQGDKPAMSQRRKIRDQYCQNRLGRLAHIWHDTRAAHHDLAEP